MSSQSNRRTQSSARRNNTYRRNPHQTRVGDGRSPLVIKDLIRPRFPPKVETVKIRLADDTQARLRLPFISPQETGEYVLQADYMSAALRQYEPALYDNFWILFENSLQHGPAADLWRPFYDRIPPGTPLTHALFNDDLREWIANRSVHLDRTNLLEYLRTLQKTVDVSVDNMADYIVKLNQLSAWLPGNAPQLVDAEINRIFFQSMPLAWQREYRTFHDPDAAALQHMREFFKNKEQLANERMLQNERDQHSSRRRPRDDQEMIMKIVGVIVHEDEDKIVQGTPEDPQVVAAAAVIHAVTLEVLHEELRNLPTVLFILTCVIPTLGVNVIRTPGIQETKPTTPAMIIPGIMVPGIIIQLPDQPILLEQQV
jgi:hypothetical protein